jgi:hypothetical protein
MRKFNKGDIVEIIDGPYKGIIGKIDSIVEFDPGVVGLYLIKTKDGSIIKIIDSAVLRFAEPEPEEVTEDTITISRSDLKNALDNVTRAELYKDKFSDPAMIEVMILSGMLIGAKLERELFDD